MGDHRDERREYAAGTLSRADLPEDPLDLFGAWLSQSIDAGVPDATAMALATASSKAEPSVRIVLLKEHGPAGFIWFTDYGSRKGLELAANPQASLAFYWGPFSRQVRVSGAVSPVDADESRAYFASRPEDSRFSAAASDQSQPIGGRAMLEARVAELRAQHPEGDVPMPEGWGGYRLLPAHFEFWQGREGRLHDRFAYTKRGDDWAIDRLQP